MVLALLVDQLLEVVNMEWPIDTHLHHGCFSKNAPRMERLLPASNRNADVYVHQLVGKYTNKQISSRDPMQNDSAIHEAHN